MGCQVRVFKQHHRIMYIHEVISAQEYTLPTCQPHLHPHQRVPARVIIYRKYIMKTSIPSQKLVVQVNPMKMLCSCYARLYGCHGILGGVISVSVVFSMWMITKW